MTARKFARNDPCPCGSGKKFKHCCISKDIDWEERRAASIRKPFFIAASRPKTTSPPGLAVLGPFRVVDSRLKETARKSLEAADWKAAVEHLCDELPDRERMAIYKAVREAHVVPEDAAFFLFGHAVQWMPCEEDDLDGLCGIQVACSQAQGDVYLLIPITNVVQEQPSSPIESLVASELGCQSRTLLREINAGI